MKTGIIKTSLKEHERRVPIYPEHVNKIDRKVLNNLVFETGYGADYGFDDDYFVQSGATVSSREEIFSVCKCLVVPKPTEKDLLMMNNDQLVWGWFHCVQQKKIVQAAIDKRLTLIAWESMFQWSPGGEKLMHIFYKNNELAGYASILHVLQLLGVDGFYGPRRRVNIIGYGSCSRGAIHALHGRGFNNLHVYSRRPPHLVANQHPGVYYHFFYPDHGNLKAVNDENCVVPFIEELSKADIICNCILQDTDNPIMFIKSEEVKLLKERSIIVDVSCDNGLGFPFAYPTTFNNPLRLVDNKIWYYSIDHAPTYLWDAASREISKAIIAYLPAITEGDINFSSEETLKNAVEIINGHILNNKIFTFQNRSQEFPHDYL